jgi:small subunit ribosomal protein S20
MPNIKSAEKRVRQSAKRRAINRSARSEVGSSRRELLEAIKAGKKDEARKLYAAYSSQLDKAAKRDILKSNNANRKKSRLAQRLAAMA